MLLLRLCDHRIHGREEARRGCLHRSQLVASLGHALEGLDGQHAQVKRRVVDVALRQRCGRGGGAGWCGCSRRRRRRRTTCQCRSDDLLCQLFRTASRPVTDTLSVRWTRQTLDCTHRSSVLATRSGWADVVADGQPCDDGVHASRSAMMSSTRSADPDVISCSHDPKRK